MLKTGISILSLVTSISIGLLTASLIMESKILVPFGPLIKFTAWSTVISEVIVSPIFNILSPDFIPALSAGVFLRDANIYASLAIIFGAFAGLIFLLSISKRKRFYPAMPFITAGLFVGIALAYLYNYIFLII